MITTRPLLRVNVMSNDSTYLNLGALRSIMSLTLHTHHASRIWHGRRSAEGRPGIVSLGAYIGIINRMKHGAEQDDPYSDWWMIRVEEKLAQTKTTLKNLREQVDHVLANVPPALSLGENLNVQPITLQLFVNAQLGFMAVYLLAEFDDLVRNLILAHHTALIDRHTLDHWLEDSSHAMRSLLSLPQYYRYSGACRDDFAAKNAVARAALEKFGELPQDVLEGTRRSRYAPPILRRSAAARPAPAKEPKPAPAVQIAVALAGDALNPDGLPPSEIDADGATS